MQPIIRNPYFILSRREVGGGGGAWSGFFRCQLLHFSPKLPRIFFRVFSNLDPRPHPVANAVKVFHFRSIFRITCCHKFCQIHYYLAFQRKYLVFESENKHEHFDFDNFLDNWNKLDNLSIAFKVLILLFIDAP